MDAIDPMWATKYRAVHEGSGANAATRSRSPEENRRSLPRC